MIILTPEQKDRILEVRESHLSEFEELGIDVDPVEIKGGYFTLPEEILKDERLSKFVRETGLNENFFFEKREVVENEKFVDDIETGERKITTIK